MTSSIGYRYLEVAPDDLRRELYVTSVGCVEYRAGDRYPESGHPADYDFTWNQGRVLGDFAAVYIEKGSGVFESRVGRFPCQAGDAFLVAPGEWHRYRPDKQTGWRERWICANGEYLHRLRAKRHLVASGLMVSVDSTRLLDALRRTHRIVVTQGAPNDLATAALALEVFGLLAPSTAGGKSPGDRPKTGDQLVDAAREFIWLNSHRSLTVAQIAAHLGISRRTLERRYSRTCGHTIVSALIDHRVRAARQLLVETRMSVKEISYAVGFGDSRRLIRNFSRLFLKTPEAFRKNGPGTR